MMLTLTSASRWTFASRERKSPPRTALAPEPEDVFPRSGQRPPRGPASQARADDDYGIFPLIRWADQLHFESVPRPFLRDQAARDLAVERHGRAYQRSANVAHGA